MSGGHHQMNTNAIGCKDLVIGSDTFSGLAHSKGTRTWKEIYDEIVNLFLIILQDPGKNTLRSGKTEGKIVFDTASLAKIEIDKHTIGEITEMFKKVGIEPIGGFHSTVLEDENNILIGENYVLEEVA